MLTSLVAGTSFAIRMLPRMTTFSPLILSMVIGIAYHNVVGTAAWARQGAVPMVMSPTEFDAYLRKDIEKWANVVKISGAKVE